MSIVCKLSGDLSFGVCLLDLFVCLSSSYASVLCVAFEWFDDWSSCLVVLVQWFKKFEEWLRKFQMEITTLLLNHLQLRPLWDSPNFFRWFYAFFFFFSSICICLLIFWWICLWLCCFLIDLIIYHSIWLDNMLLQLAFQTDFHLVALLFYPEKLHYWLKIWSNARGVSKKHFLLASCKSIHAKYMTEKLFLL